MFGSAKCLFSASKSVLLLYIILLCSIQGQQQQNNYCGDVVRLVNVLLNVWTELNTILNVQVISDYIGNPKVIQKIIIAYHFAHSDSVLVSSSADNL